MYLVFRSVALGVILRVTSIILEANASLDSEELNKQRRKKRLHSLDYSESEPIRNVIWMSEFCQSDLIFIVLL